METGDRLVKDPNSENWPKGIDWTRYLARIAADETIASSDWTVTGGPVDADGAPIVDASPLTTSDKSIVTGSKKTQLRLSGGTLNAEYVLTNRITTSSGVVDDRGFTLVIKNQ